MKYPLIIRDILRFRYESGRFRDLNNQVSRFILFRYFPRWRKLERQSDSVKFRLPWISFPAIGYIERHLNRSMKVFEYGCGGSTLFFADRAGTVISTEHDEAWFGKLSAVLEKENSNSVTLRLVLPEKREGDGELYYSGNELYSGMSFSAYVRAIDEYPDDYFDLILIDGRARNGCFMHSIRKLRKGGLIVWDNSERSRYRDFFTSNPMGLRKLEFPGPTPFSRYFTLTTVFIK